MKKVLTILKSVKKKLNVIVSFEDKHLDKKTAPYVYRYAINYSRTYANSIIRRMYLSDELPNYISEPLIAEIKRMVDNKNIAILHSAKYNTEVFPDRANKNQAFNSPATFNTILNNADNRRLGIFAKIILTVPNITFIFPE